MKRSKDLAPRVDSRTEGEPGKLYYHCCSPLLVDAAAAAYSMPSWSRRRSRGDEVMSEKSVEDRVFDEKSRKNVGKMRKGRKNGASRKSEK